MILYGLAFINVFIFLYFYIKYSYNVVLCLPITLVILEISRSIANVNLVEEGVGGIQVIVFSLYCLVLIGQYIRKSKFVGLFTVIVIISFYYFLRMDFTEQFNSMVVRYLNFILLLLFVPLTASIIKRINQVHFFLKSFYVGGVIYLIFVLIASILKFGPNMYGTNIIFGFEFEQWYYGALFIACFPLFYATRKVNSYKYLNVVTILMILVLFLTLRRLTLVIILLIIIQYVLLDLTNKKKLGLAIKVLTFVTFGVLIVFISGVYMYRESRFSSDYEMEEEGRFVEWVLVNESIKENPLLGKGTLFNDLGRYGYRKDYRSLHGTYSRILFGSGYIGLFIFLALYIYYLFKLFKAKQKIRKKNNLNFEFVTVGIAVWSTYIFVASSGASGIGAGISYVVTSLIISSIVLSNVFQNEI